MPTLEPIDIEVSPRMSGGMYFANIVGKRGSRAQGSSVESAILDLLKTHGHELSLPPQALTNASRPALSDRDNLMGLCCDIEERGGEIKIRFIPNLIR